MTSTKFNVGLGESRCSSRVLKPPGGGQTNIFSGSEDGKGKQNFRNQSSEIQSCFQYEAEVKKDNVKIEPKQKQEEKATPEMKTEESPRQNRVRVPPGGFSSGLW